MGNPVAITNGTCEDAIVPTLSDTVDLPNWTNSQQYTKGIYVGVSGDVKVTLKSGNAVTFVGLVAGVFHPIACKRIWSSSTTATSILAVY